MNNHNEILPVILFIGSGIRLCPLSKEILSNKLQQLIVGSDYYLSQNKYERRWRSNKLINIGDKWQVKEIIFKISQKLSLQSQYQRSENSIDLKGSELSEINETEDLFRENAILYEPLGSKHRFINPSKINMNLIEVQTDSHLEEGEIIGYYDIYGREKSNNLDFN